MHQMAVNPFLHFIEKNHLQHVHGPAESTNGNLTVAV
jgi:hypothetical protein